VLVFLLDFFDEDFLEEDFRDVLVVDERLEAFFFADFRPPDEDFFGGTFPPSRRASDNPIAIACFLLFTLRPEPLFRVPRLRLCIALFTLLDAFLPYLAIVASFCNDTRLNVFSLQRKR
jgi:hypothetical protein